MPERVETVIVGGGQGGLSVGYELTKRGRPFVILDAHERVGDAWRTRWDSLLLFTPARYDGLAGMRFPARGDVFPTKDQMADYLEAYAERFRNSGADIALEIARGHPTWMAGEGFGHIPFRIESFAGRNLLVRIVRFVGHHVLTVRTPIGRKVRPKLRAAAAPLIRVKPKDLVGAGIERVPKVVGVRDGLPLLQDGRVLEVANVVWCTGFRPGFSWIDLPVLGEREEPLHQRGVVATEPGLYFVGLKFLYAATSDTVTGVGRDAERVAKHIASRGPKGSPSPDLSARSATS